MEASNREAAGPGSTAVVAEDRRAEGGEGSRLPPLLSSRPLPLQVIQAGLVPAAFGAICGWLLGVNKVAYLVLVIPVAILGGAAAGLEHSERRSAALRGLVGGGLFGGFILIVHELSNKDPKVDLPHPAFQLAVFTAVIGAALGSFGSRRRADAESGERYLDFSRGSPAELVGMGAALVLLGSLWLPWFATSDTNRHSTITSAKIGFGETATAWQTFPVLRWLLIAACIAPFILSWILIRGHDLTWRPGEVTMIVGITAFVLILCNGVILGKPEPGIAISISIGYLVGLLGCVGMLVAGYLRQAVYTDARKPPGVL